MIKKLLLILFLPLFTSAQTWSGEVASIIYDKCSRCHNSNGIAPFELMSFQDAVDNASDIESAVTDRVMPPWPPDPAYSGFAHQRVLSAQEINDITAWVANGTPRGDSLQEPGAPVFTGIAQISTPDLIVQIPAFTINTPSDDLYRCFVLPTGISLHKYITAMEAVPGNRAVVHHVLIYADTSSVPDQLDAADPGPGYTSFGGTGSPNSKLLGVWVPGQGAEFLPSGMGIGLEANSKIILQIHYPRGISNQVDSTQIRFQLTSNFQREVYITTPLHHGDLDNGPLYIPANTTRTFTAHYQVTFDITALAVGPHMHLIGRSIQSYGVTPGNDTIPFIDIPEWDFHWQGMYHFPRLLKIPNGTTLYSSAYYDNTVNNPNNPNNPPQPVFLGEATTDEMMLVFFSYTFYFPGDENVIIDTSVVASVPGINYSQIVSTAQLYAPYPNPTTGDFQVDYFLPKNSSVKFRILDLQGKEVWNSGTKNVPAGYQKQWIGNFHSGKGEFLLQLQSETGTRIQKILIR
ncbi:MAG: T9SS type A sorting domain-containing protein [Bacteroidetes bacterium]|nr:T9SS type A sorting domain-containing protein [Bacteroidota bacterium]